MFISYYAKLHYIVQMTSSQKNIIAIDKIQNSILKNITWLINGYVLLHVINIHIKLCLHLMILLCTFQKFDLHYSNFTFHQYFYCQKHLEKQILLKIVFHVFLTKYYNLTCKINKNLSICHVKIIS